MGGKCNMANPSKSYLDALAKLFSPTMEAAKELWHRRKALTNS